MLSRVTIPEGMTVKDTLTLISQKWKLKPADLQKAAKDAAALGLPSYAKGNPEGFLFPETYDLEPDTTAASLLKEMVDQYKAKVEDSGLVQRAAAKHLTPYELLIVASLVEKETLQPDERAKVARVIYNRLDQDFYLGIDAAVLYGLGRSKGGLSEADLAKVTPYNNRLVKGLPPTPISNPGVASFEAAAAPASGDLALLRARPRPPGPPPVHRRPGRVQRGQDQVPAGQPLLIRPVPLRGAARGTTACGRRPGRRRAGAGRVRGCSSAWGVRSLRAGPRAVPGRVDAVGPGRRPGAGQALVGAAARPRRGGSGSSPRWPRSPSARSARRSGPRRAAGVPLAGRGRGDARGDRPGRLRLPDRLTLPSYPVGLVLLALPADWPALLRAVLAAIAAGGAALLLALRAPSGGSRARRREAARPARAVPRLARLGRARGRRRSPASCSARSPRWRCSRPGGPACATTWRSGPG